MAAESSGTHEVWIELTSGSRAIVGQGLGSAAEASALARTWLLFARADGDEFHETMPGSGIVVRGNAIVAVRAQREVIRGRLAGPREGWWL